MLVSTRGIPWIVFLKLYSSFCHLFSRIGYVKIANAIFSSKNRKLYSDKMEKHFFLRLRAYCVFHFIWKMVRSKKVLCGFSSLYIMVKSLKIHDALKILNNVRVNVHGDAYYSIGTNEKGLQKNSWIYLTILFDIF